MVYYMCTCDRTVRVVKSAITVSMVELNLTQSTPLDTSWF